MLLLSLALLIWILEDMRGTRVATVWFRGKQQKVHDFPLKTLVVRGHGTQGSGEKVRGLTERIQVPQPKGLGCGRSTS